MDITPFQVHIPDSVLDDLRERLARTRWPDEIPGSDWGYGSNLAYVKELVEYWRTTFDWRKQEEFLNSFDHFRTNVDGLGIHFIQAKGKGPNPLPLVITHGWPSTFFEMLKVIPRLTDPAAYGGDPADSFDVVVPSMPGYGFSDAAQEPGMNTARIADLWAKLMTENLGYQRFVAQGGDWGASVTARLGYAYPQQVAGIHVTAVSAATMSPHLGDGTRPLSEREQALIEERAQWREAEGGYSHIQGTKPQTLSYGLNDSPTGLAAWIVEKFRTWSDCGGDVESRFTRDELLTNITLYWATNSIGSSVRLYYESQHNPWALGAGDRISVPCAVALFPVDLSHPPREWAERSYNVQRWTEMPRGGHFAALEEPDLLVDDMGEFFRAIR
ncbi:Putative epoxide hydrolase [Geodia barretti]|uniref:Epoxide hydrolase n=1 Tax=Geodia barretti TaxID=519541 RepID=A0AA35S3D7_GEOBA|nr:Putative epoxide hydrolase [Geodia barretti]